MPERRTPDYYAVLGIPRDADGKAIKDAFRKLTMRYHPDRSKEAGAAERFKEIAAAYAVLSDPDKRAAYDARGRAAEEYTPEDLFGRIDPGDWFDLTGFGADWLGRLFGGRFGGHRRGADLEAHLTISLNRVADGGDERVLFTRPSPCPRCRGTGYESESTRAQRVERIRCRTCRGSGQVGVEDSVVVSVPAGIEDGTILRVAGRGTGGAGGTSGDLLVLVTTRPDPRFARAGADLLAHVTVDVIDAILGREVPLPSLRGSVVLRIPEGTQPNTVLRLRGQGLPRLGSHHRGDLLVTVGVRIPERLSREARRAFETLRSHPT